jgi:hypothetical protein
MAVCGFPHSATSGWRTAITTHRADLRAYRSEDNHGPRGAPPRPDVSRELSSPDRAFHVETPAGNTRRAGLRWGAPASLVPALRSPYVSPRTTSSPGRHEAPQLLQGQGAPRARRRSPPADRIPVVRASQNLDVATPGAPCRLAQEGPAADPRLEERGGEIGAQQGEDQAGDPFPERCRQGARIPRRAASGATRATGARTGLPGGRTVRFVRRFHSATRSR